MFQALVETLQLEGGDISSDDGQGALGLGEAATIAPPAPEADAVSNTPAEVAAVAPLAPEAGVVPTTPVERISFDDAGLTPTEAAPSRLWTMRMTSH